MMLLGGPGGGIMLRWGDPEEVERGPRRGGSTLGPRPSWGLGMGSLWTKEVGRWLGSDMGPESGRREEEYERQGGYRGAGAWLLPDRAQR